MGGHYDRKDRLYRKAKDEGFRSRAAFKLTELNKKHALFARESRVVDLGCSPGGWLQVVAEAVREKGVVLGVDLELTLEFPGGERGLNKGGAAVPILICGDITEENTRAIILEKAQGFVDTVLSDMSPKLSGIGFRDALLSSQLVEAAFSVAEDVLKEGGAFVAKIFPGQEADSLYKRLQPRFVRLSRALLDSSRKSSNELYFVGKGFRRKAE